MINPMGPVLQFILALAVAATSLAGSSLLWPRFTTQERPALLKNVRDIVMKNPVGQHTADVLGVSDESQVTPINPGELVAGAVNGMKTAVQNRIRTVVVGNAVNELTRQYDKLPRDQQQFIQAALCKPESP